MTFHNESKKLCFAERTRTQCVFTSDDEHFIAGEFDEEKDRTKAEYLGSEIRDALEGSKWEHAASWHIYRHSLASTMLNSGYSQIEVKELIGWCSDAIAAKYQHQTFARKSAIVNQIFKSF